MLDDLAKKCIDYIQKDININDVCYFLNHSVHFEEEQLVNRCLDVCASNTAAVLQSQGFSELSQAALLTFLKHDHLAFDQEEAIIKACIGWAKKNQGGQSETLREILADCVYQMRFFQLTSEKLVHILDDSSLLTVDEKLLFLSGSLTKSKKHGKQLHDLGFVMHSRSILLERPEYPQQINPVFDKEEEILSLSLSVTHV